MRPLKWVFAINGDTKSYDEMTKIAALSALHNTSLVPVCILTGASADAEIALWLRKRGVRVVHHNQLRWRAALETAMMAAGGHESRSPLYMQARTRRAGL